jgi:isoleucyl-tRNA synthetase
MDRWILSRFQTLVRGVQEEMEVYRLYLVVPKVLDFIEDLTNWYIRLNRRRFWGNESSDSQDTHAAYSTLYFVLLEFSKVFAPFAPFISEHIFLEMSEGLAGVKGSVHLCDYPKPDTNLIDKDLETRMHLLRVATNLGRSLRAQHQIKTRQALPSMLVITRHKADGRHIESGSSLLKEELNVKEISFTTDEANFVRLSVKPNLRTLGPRLGKELSKVRQYFEEMSKSHEKVAGFLAQIEDKGSADALGHSLTEKDLLIERGPRDHRLIATQSGLTILLDTNLSEELILEGLSREVVNRIQKLRKDSGLQVSDRIQLSIMAEGKLSQAVQLHSEYISGETLAVKLNLAESATGLNSMQFKTKVDIEGADCSIGFSVVS